MKYVKLRGTSLEVSALSMGTWGFSGMPVWGASDDDVSIKPVHQAIDYGINLFDSAARYGNGKAEEVLGKAVRGKRDKAIIATKVFMDSLAYDKVIEQCEQSLKRLGTDYIDIYLIHWPNREVDPKITMAAFEKLKSDGKIRQFGVCNHGVTSLEAIKDHNIVINQLPYSLIWRLIEKKGMIDMCIKENIAIWAYSPLAQGLLTGKYKSIDDVPLNRRDCRIYNSKWGQGRHTDGGFESEVFDFLAKLAKVSERTGYDMAALSMAFLKSRPGMGSVLVGSRDITQLEQNIKSFETDVPDEVICEITELSGELKNVMGDNADMWENKNGGRMF